MTHTLGFFSYHKTFTSEGAKEEKEDQETTKYNEGN